VTFISPFYQNSTSPIAAASASVFFGVFLPLDAGAAPLRLGIKTFQQGLAQLVKSVPRKALQRGSSEHLKPALRLVFSFLSCHHFPFGAGFWSSAQPSSHRAAAVRDPNRCLNRKSSRRFKSAASRRM
jgi:hypothetical protein